MLIDKAQHYIHELDTWLRALEYLREENVHLKNHLSNIAVHDLDRSLLDRVEYFQNQFLNKDALIALLRHEIADQKRTAEKSKDDHHFHEPDTTRRQDKLRRDMETTEREFNKLKSEFNRFVSLHVEV